jgi:transposase
VSTVDFGILFPHLAGVRVEMVRADGPLLRVQAAADQVEASCPDCGGASRRVHSRYQRRIYDQAVAGRRTVIHLKLRRFFCDAGECRKTTFAEQVTGLTARHARHSVPTRQVLTRIALAVGGRAGQRLTGHLALSTGRMTLLRLIRTLPEPAVATPRVLGVDDFALRRGHIYATILIDMETHAPVDVLPDRTADTLAGWLRERPGVEIICRDRAGAYAEGASTGAPDAVQVADRFHLWRNLGQAVEKDVVAHRGDLREPAPEPVAPPPPRPEPATTAPVQPAEPRLVTRTRERYTAVQRLLADGVSRADVSRQLGLDPHTVRRFADAASINDLLVHTRRDSLIDAFKPHLNQRFNDGCTDASVLFAEIRQQGFRGSVKTVRRYIQPFRAAKTAPPANPAPPKPRHVTSWIMTKPDNLAADDQARLTAITSRSPILNNLAGHVRAFAKMMTNLAGTQLLQWIGNVLADDTLPGLRSFATGLQRDLAAVTAGLTLRWSSGAVEGQVNRIKMIKRQMFGRAKFDLLRRRILAPT